MNDRKIERIIPLPYEDGKVSYIVRFVDGVVMTHVQDVIAK